MMAVNSWLITIKRRIKLPLGPPGAGSAAISALEHYCSATAALKSFLSKWKKTLFIIRR